MRDAWMPAWTILTWLCATGLPTLTAMANDTQGFRLAGVMAAGHDYLAVLELPSGEQTLIRRGDAVPDGGSIESIEPHSIRVAFPSGTVEFRLDGSTHRIITPAAGAVGETAGEGNIRVVNVDPERMRQEVERPVDSLSGPASPATQRRGRKDAGAELGRRFASIAGLPTEARVLAVNEQPVTSAESALREVDRGLQQGLPVRLNLANGQGPQHRVYLLPMTGEQTTQ